MMTPRPPRYADRLLDFPDIVFGGEGVFEHRGQWHQYFRARMGVRFEGTVVFEIGCSDAESLCRIAARCPGVGFVGLDWKAKSLGLGAARVTELGLSNVALLRGRAQDASRIFGYGELDEIWVFHPDPCDRPVELKNRLIAEPFLVGAHRVLRPGGRLCLKTDHPGYYQSVLGLLGLPQPAWFEAARTAHANPGWPRYAGPRVKVREVVPPHEVPAASGPVRERFEVAMNTPDYWNDPAALAHTAARGFAGEVTYFENRFLNKRLPIYYVEIAKAAHDTDVAAAPPHETNPNGPG